MQERGVKDGGGLWDEMALSSLQLDVRERYCIGEGYCELETTGEGEGDGLSSWSAELGENWRKKATTYCTSNQPHSTLKGKQTPTTPPNLFWGVREVQKDGTVSRVMRSCAHGVTLLLMQS
jgi:hypothetical protein